MENKFSENQKKISALRKFWNFLKEDSWSSLLVSLIIIVLLIKFVLFPAITYLTGSPLPLVVVKSCSMHHDGSFDDWWFRYSSQYDKFGITKEQFEQFPMKNGFNKGDIIFIFGKSEIQRGDVIVFYPNSESSAPNPIIHRTVTKDPTGTKGDNGETNPTQLNGLNFQKLDERTISNSQIIGEAKFRVPLVGWIKLIFFEPFTAPSQRGFC